MCPPSNSGCGREVLARIEHVIDRDPEARKVLGVDLAQAHVDVVPASDQLLGRLDGFFLALGLSLEGGRALVDADCKGLEAAFDLDDGRECLRVNRWGAFLRECHEIHTLPFFLILIRVNLKT